MSCKYVLVKQDQKSRFEEEVNSYLSKGYEFVGTLSTATTIVSGGKSSKVTYIREMIKKPSTYFNCG